MWIWMLLMTHKVRAKQNRRRLWGASTASEGHSTLLPWQHWPPSEKFCSCWLRDLRGGGPALGCVQKQQRTHKHARPLVSPLPPHNQHYQVSRGEAEVHVQPWAESLSELSPGKDTQTRTRVSLTELSENQKESFQSLRRSQSNRSFTSVPSCNM